MSQRAQQRVPLTHGLPSGKIPSREPRTIPEIKLRRSTQATDFQTPLTPGRSHAALTSQGATSNELATHKAICPHGAFRGIMQATPAQAFQNPLSHEGPPRVFAEREASREGMVLSCRVRRGVQKGPRLVKPSRRSDTQDTSDAKSKDDHASVTRRDRRKTSLLRELYFDPQ